MTMLLNSHPSQPASPEQQALLALPPLMDCFPVVVGEYTWKQLSVLCIVCQGEIARNEFRGSVDQTDPSMAHVNAIGFCPRCQVHSPAALRLSDTGRLFVAKNGEWMPQEVKTSFWNDFSKTLDL